MNRHAWTTAAFRLMAAWLMVEATIGWSSGILNYYFTMLGMPEQVFSRTGLMVITMIGSLLPFAVAAFLWRFSGRLAALVWRDLPEVQERVPISVADVQVALFAALGVYLLVDGVPHVVGQIVMRLTAPTGFESNPELVQRYRLSLLNGASRLAVGACLLFGPRQLVTWLRRLRGPREDE